MVIYRDQWEFPNYLPSTDALNGSILIITSKVAGGRFELAMQLMAIGLVSLNSNSEMHMTAICDARLIYGRGQISQVFISCGPLILSAVYKHRSRHAVGSIFMN